MAVVFAIFLVLVLASVGYRLRYASFSLLALSWLFLVSLLNSSSTKGGMIQVFLVITFATMALMRIGETFFAPQDGRQITMNILVLIGDAGIAFYVLRRWGYPPFTPYFHPIVVFIFLWWLIYMGIVTSWRSVPPSPPKPASHHLTVHGQAPESPASRGFFASGEKRCAGLMRGGALNVKAKLRP